MARAWQPDRRLRRARIGTTATFGLAAAMAAVWTVRIPALSDKLDLDPSDLGFTVLAWGIGALVTMQATRGLMARTGSRAALRVASPVSAATLALIGIAPTYPTLLAAAAVFGMAFGVMDIAMNAQAASIERAYDAHLMNGMHAGWSIGAVAGGLLGAGAAALGWGFAATVLAMAGVALPLALALGSSYLPDAEPAAAGRTGGPRLPRIVYLFGALAFAAFMVEGSVADWSGLYLRDDLRASEPIAALGYPGFECGMIAGRLVGDRVRAAIGARALLSIAGVAAAVAFGFVIAAQWWWLGLLGFVLVGVAVCTVVPLTFSLAGDVDRTIAAAAIAQTGTFGYTGLLLGPVVLGIVAEDASLRAALLIVVGLCLAIAAGGRALPPRWRNRGHDEVAAEPSRSR